jgi:hypothetical protein
MVLLKGVCIGTLYKLLGINISDRCNSSIVHEIGAEEEKTPTISEEKTMLWHQRPGHIGGKGLQVLNDKGMVEGTSNSSLDFYFYEHCLYGKKNHVRFPSGAMREEGILQLVHIDVFGSMLTPSLGKCLYRVSFIDDLLSNTWIYFVGKKYGVFEKFKEFKDFVENQTNERIKVLRIDNDGQFYGNELEELCKKCSIVRNKMNPYTPQHNGVAERMNNMSMEKTRCMLSGVGLGQELGEEAMGTTLLVGQSITLIIIERQDSTRGMDW